MYFLNSSYNEKTKNTAVSIPGCSVCPEPTGCTCMRGRRGPAGPRGATGPTGTAGPTGPAGTAATISVGNVITGEPGTPVQITNSGTDENAVFDFVIPKGDPGGGGKPEVLATSDPSTQTSADNTPLTFPDNPLISGTAITHQAGASDVVINQQGIYQASFQTTVSVPSGTSIPATVTAQLYQNGAPITGASARHTITASNELSTMSFNIPFQVTTTPGEISVIISEAGINFSESTLTIMRLGDTT